MTPRNDWNRAPEPQGVELKQTCTSQEINRFNEAAASNTDTYKYRPLPEAGWIRVVVLEPSGDPTFRISCKLKHQPIRGGPPFNALSYTWGTDTAIAPILVDGMIIRVRYNLFRALQNLRLTNASRTVWIDAICINQTDNTERTNQVTQMTDIYSCAEEVVIWLNEPDKAATLDVGNSLAALDALTRRTKTLFTQPVNSQFQGKEQLYEAMNQSFADWLMDPRSDIWIRCIIALCTRDWWDRVWTLQEIGLAVKARVQAGKSSIDWEAFETLSVLTACLANHAPSQHYLLPPKVLLTLKLCRPAFSRADSIRTLRERMRQELRGGIPLSLMLDMSTNRIATDPRDKVFGILGIVDHGQRMVPDYTLSVKAVYTEAMKQMITSFGDLRAHDIFRDTGCRIETLDLPSWVPNFASLCSVERLLPLTFRTGVTKTDVLAMSALYSAGTFRRGEITKHFASFVQDTLILKGVPIDTINLLGSTLLTDGPLLEPRKGEFGRAIAQWRSLVSIDHHKMYVTGISAVEAFWRTVALDCKIIDYHPGINLINNPRNRGRRLENNDPLVPPKGSESRFIAALENQSQWRESMQVGRCFFTTHGGYMGVGPPCAQPGDVVCAIFGGEVPYILRPQKNGHYTMVGQWQVTPLSSLILNTNTDHVSYLHGVMDGEAIEGVGQGKFWYETFVIE